ncbi:MAG: hypothetical protein B7X86_07480 [Sphingobacteriales bacterium 17-39-43]|nr:MAG: hypothetical protein B7Y76_02035 [Sphingobacteriia bacterium 35-40-5]OYZ31796.1 MAG: hypothetical protein B7Y24_08145 [Sphingobacteriales bacterium 16-39-50]OZA24879.1 MAG: hypothetical protein B7X86_07480 [Sphingobacteriales bacterium 17-39-43]
MFIEAGRGFRGNDNQCLQNEAALGGLDPMLLFKDWEVPAFAGMTNLMGGIGRFQPSLESGQVTYFF